MTIQVADRYVMPLMVSCAAMVVRGASRARVRLASSRFRSTQPSRPRAKRYASSDALRTPASTREWARARSAESLAVGRQYLDGRGPLPQRAAQLELTARFITDFYALVGT